MIENEEKQTGMSEKIKILFLAANPAFTPPLKIDREIRAITGKIRDAKYRDSIELVSAWAVRPEDLQQTLLEHRPHIVHFSGHGETTGELLLLDKDGNPKPVKPEAIQALFTALKDNIRIVFFNTCYSQVQAQALTEVIDFVIGMNTFILDTAATVFAASFYQALGYGRTIQEAFDLGKTALMLEGFIDEKNTPKLLPGNEAAPNQVFIVKPTKTLEETKEPLPDPFIEGLKKLEIEDYEAALEHFDTAFKKEPENEERGFYYCLSFLSGKPLLAIKKGDMDEINRLLNKIVVGVDQHYANLARIVLGIIHYDYYIKQNFKSRGLDNKNIFRYLGHNPPGEEEKKLVSHIAYSESAGKMCFLI